ncbi:hypothetical protein [Cumulibacter soli]|uniref:hypothetical protein n=1 Tax=Cumulibacter soli TaxID=2546344 RepID=UPI00106810B7|nr:hypothetical protein [Cumulibacter soli]
MTEEPEFFIPTLRIRATLDGTEFDTDYYRWCDHRLDWRALARNTYEEDSLATARGGFAPLAVTEFIKAFRNAGAKVARVGRTNAFTVSVVAGEVSVELECRLGRGINTMSPALSVSAGDSACERRVPLSELARTVFMSKNQHADDPLYPYPVVSSRSHLEVLSREIVDWMQRIAENYPA